MAIDKTKHKANCAAIADETKACDCGGITDPETRVCWDCDATIGKSEKKCPKCGADPTVADEEDGVVERSINRLKKKRKKNPPKDKEPEPDTTPKKKHIFSSLSRLVK